VQAETLKLVAIMANNFFLVCGGAGLDLRHPQTIVWSVIDGPQAEMATPRNGSGGPRHQRPAPYSDRGPHLRCRWSSSAGGAGLAAQWSACSEGRTAHCLHHQGISEPARIRLAAAKGGISAAPRQHASGTIGAGICTTPSKGSDWLGGSGRPSNIWFATRRKPFTNLSIGACRSRAPRGRQDLSAGRSAA